MSTEKQNLNKRIRKEISEKKIKQLTEINPNSPKFDRYPKFGEIVRPIHMYTTVEQLESLGVGIVIDTSGHPFLDVYWIREERTTRLDARWRQNYILLDVEPMTTLATELQTKFRK